MSPQNAIILYSMAQYVFCVKFNEGLFVILFVISLISHDSCDLLCFVHNKNPVKIKRFFFFKSGLPRMVLPVSPCLPASEHNQ